MRVVDASVAVKWFLTEPDNEAAMRIIEDNGVLTAPSIIRLEVLGAISRHFREGRLAEPKARDACDAWMGMIQAGHLRLIPTNELIEDALRLSFACRHAVVDCLYLAAAKQLKVELVTADRTLLERAAKGKARVVLLGAARFDG